MRGMGFICHVEPAGDVPSETNLGPTRMIA